MAIGAIHFISLGKNPRGVPRYEYLVAAFIPIWSGLAYLAMTLPHGELEQGKIEVAGQITHFARYIDWIVTTPLLLLALSWTGMNRLHHKDWTLIAALMATQVIVIACGLIADFPPFLGCDIYGTSTELLPFWSCCGGFGDLYAPKPKAKEQISPVFTTS